MLFDAGANGIGQNARRNSALLAAVHNSHINVVKCILEKCPITVQVRKSSDKKKHEKTHQILFPYFSKQPSNNGLRCMRLASMDTLRSFRFWSIIRILNLCWKRLGIFKFILNFFVSKLINEFTIVLVRMARGNVDCRSIQICKMWPDKRHCTLHVCWATHYWFKCCSIGKWNSLKMNDPFRR